MTSPLTASIVSASGEFIGHTFTHNVGLYTGRIASFTATAGSYSSPDGQDLGAGEPSSAEDPVVSVRSIVFNAPYSCSLERIDWMVSFQDATSADAFFPRNHAIKIPNIGTGALGSINLSSIISPDVNNFDFIEGTGDGYRESRAYYKHHTYTGSAAALLGPGDSLALIYSSSTGGKLTAYGRCTATFRKIGE